MNKENDTLNELLPQIYKHIDVVVRSAIKEAIEELSTIKQLKEPSSDIEYLSAEEAANFLKIKLNTIYSKVEKGELPHYRSGKRKLLFSRKELERFIVSSKMKSMEEIEREVEEYIQNKRF